MTAYATLSVHLSREGAEKAIELHRQEKLNAGDSIAYMEWEVEEIEIQP